MMGGTIEVESELGRGSTFSFLIPFGKYSPDLTAEPDTGAGNGAVSLAGCRALVVDDSGGLGPTELEYLSLLGCRGEICRRSQALGRLREAAASRDPFRIALLDMSPPVPEVFALSRAIANDAAIAMAVRICCTESPIRGESRLREFGFAGVIEKPVTPAVLKEALVEALEGA
jgi:CheY-like chemotaxis protein